MDKPVTQDPRFKDRRPLTEDPESFREISRGNILFMLFVAFGSLFGLLGLLIVFSR